MMKSLTPHLPRSRWAMLWIAGALLLASLASAHHASPILPGTVTLPHPSQPQAPGY